MAFTPKQITKELDMANLAKHNDNYNAIKTELDTQASAVATHTAAQTAHGSTSEAVAGKIMQRDSAGRAKVSAPATADDIARKAEVDAVQTGLDTHEADAAVHLSAADRTKLDGIEDGAEPNQPAFSQVNDVVAASESDALTIEGGTGITITTNPTTRKVVVTATGDATPGAHGPSHNNDGADPIPDLVTLRGEFDALTPASIGAETPAGAQEKVDALAGAGNTKTVAEVSDEVADVTAQLADIEQEVAGKTNQSDFLFKKSLLYEKALHEVYIPAQALSGAKRAILSGTLKIAFIGDSITEGSDQVNINDCYVNKVQKILADAFPYTTITLGNFALSGQKLENFVDPEFVGVASQAAVIDRNKQFYRPWSTVGKTWMQSVKDFQPNLLVIAFGMNSSGSAAASNSVGNGLQTIINNFEKETYNPSIIMIPTFLPTKNTAYFSQSQLITQSVANVTKEVAKANNLVIADTNRLYCILRDGVDEGFTTYKKYSVTDLNQVIAGFYDGVISCTINPSTAGQAVRFDYRYNNESARLALLISLGTSTSTISLYYNAGGSSVLIESISTAINLSVNNTIKLEARGIYHDVYLNGTLIKTFTTYYGTGRGNVVFSAPNITATISNIVVESREPATEYPSYTELELLGEYDNPNDSGNGVNHPSGLGHSLFLVSPFFEIINNLKALPKGLQTTRTITGAWTQSVSTAFGTVTEDGLNLYYKNMGTIDYDPTFFEQYLTSSTNVRYKYNAYASRRGKLRLLKSNEYGYLKDGGGGLLFMGAASAPNDTFTLTINEPY